MGTKTFFIQRTDFYFLDRGFVLGNMFWLLGLLCNSLFFVLGSVMRCFSRCVASFLFLGIHPLKPPLVFDSRYRVEESEQSEPSSGSDSRAIEARQDNQTPSPDSGDDGLGEKEESESELGYEREAEANCSVVSAPTSITSKYQFISGINISEFVEEPKIMSLTVQEMFVGSPDSDQIPLFSRCDSEPEDSVLTFSFGMGLEKKDELVGSENDVSCKHDFSGQAPLQLKNDVSGKRDSSEEAKLHSKFDFYPEQDSISSEDDLGGCEFLLGENVTEDFGCESGTESEAMSDTARAVEDDWKPIVTVDGSDELVELEETVYVGDSEEEEEGMIYDETEEHERQSSDDDPYEEEDGVVYEDKEELERQSFDDSEEEEDGVIYDETEEPERKSSDDSEEEEDGLIYEGTEELERQRFDDSEDDVGWEFIAEHQDLIEQLKMELKNVRMGGLPTILEESESPKIVEDLEPLKIDEKKLDHKDRIEQIHKVYKNYVEKMRKLDILSYQTIHAIGFIRRKDQSELVSVKKPSGKKFPFLHNLMGSKARMAGDDPVGELERDLELVYVGQACLSWKILHWQYEKAKELCDHDPHGFRQYNQVAGEFQLFQVLMQRYVEDETFQGPRVQYYVKNRCIIRNLLQVPVIRDDKKGRKGEEESAISSVMLREIIHECMRVFWAFLRSDKKGSNVISKSLHHVQIQLQNPADKTLLIEVETDLQKKEKKLKDILRSGNCIVKKFQKHNQREIQLDHALFIAQVELTLVSRVLSMSKLTSQQLVWCHEQLGMINFTSRKVYLEPSFLLFPC